MRVTVSGDFKRDLEAVKNALSHKLPGASLEQVLHECLRVTLAACEKRRRGAGKDRGQGVARPGGWNRMVRSGVVPV